jgi:hypothetical protein
MVNRVPATSSSHGRGGYFTKPRSGLGFSKSSESN